MATINESAGESPIQLTVTTRARTGSLLLDYLSLAKPRIMALLLITAYCAMVVAAGKIPGVGLTVWTLLGLALSVGGAHAINMWYDRDIDGIMQRTRRRPVPMGRIPASHALALGILAEAVSLAVLVPTVGLLTAALSLGGFLYYVGVYTFWLKRTTPQNIVIGGGAGAFPPLVGWAAVSGRLDLAAVLMFLIVFFWTPPHFWALALYRQDDYRRAKIPMMPVTRGERVTKWQMLVYAALLLGTSLILYQTGVLGWIYLVAAVLAGVVFLLACVLLLRERAPETRLAKLTFHVSLMYLTLVFGAMVADVLLRPILLR